MKCFFIGDSAVVCNVFNFTLYKQDLEKSEFTHNTEKGQTSPPQTIK